ARALRAEPAPQLAASTNRLDLSLPARHLADVRLRHELCRANDDPRQRQVLLRDEAVGGDRGLCAPTDWIDANGGGELPRLDGRQPGAVAVQTDDRHLPPCPPRRDPGPART